MVPPRPKFVTYFRVSTRKQGRSGLGLEAQQHAVRQYLFQIGGMETATFTEVESGKDDTRPQLAKALQRCRQTRATLLIAKLDRLSRSGAFLYRLKDDGTRFQALDIPEANTLTLGVMIAMTQHEREIISKRTRDALARRRAKGLPLGNPQPAGPVGVPAESLRAGLLREPGEGAGPREGHRAQHRGSSGRRPHLATPDRRIPQRARRRDATWQAMDAHRRPQRPQTARASKGRLAPSYAVPRGVSC